MAVRKKFLRRNAWATDFGNMDLVPSASTLASRLLPSSPLKRPDKSVERVIAFNEAELKL